jgi:hypothetical protein
MWSLFLAVFYNLFCVLTEEANPGYSCYAAGRACDSRRHTVSGLPGMYDLHRRRSLEPGQYMFVQDNRRLFNFLISVMNL